MSFVVANGSGLPCRSPRCRIVIVVDHAAQRDLALFRERCAERIRHEAEAHGYEHVETPLEFSLEHALERTNQVRSLALLREKHVKGGKARWGKW